MRSARVRSSGMIKVHNAQNEWFLFGIESKSIYSNCSGLSNISKNVKNASCPFPTRRIGNYFRW